MRTATRRTAEGLVVAGGVVLLRPGTRANKVVCRSVDEAGRRLRYAGGRLQGLSYRLGGRHPDPHVGDNVLADRIRSSLGGLEKRLDLPHVHVTVERGVAVLHGEVGSAEDARQLERAVEAVSGVAGVESYLHVGLGAGDTRPSQGRAVHPPSDAMRRLIEAATHAGVDAGAARPVVRAVLATFADRLPPAERDRVSAHLPADVRSLFEPPQRSGERAPARTVHELVVRVAATAGDEVSTYDAEPVTRAVIGAFRSLVPEERRDVAAVLPAELRALWETPAAPPAGTQPPGTQPPEEGT